jgi:tetratricopeptide (TPR) repeat protein
MVDALSYDVFISYSRRDNDRGWVSGLYDAILQDFKPFSPPIEIFFDKSEIKDRHDWELRLRQGLRTSRVLLVCLSPNYLRSPCCKWEWDEFTRYQARRAGGGDAVAGVFFVGLGGDEHDDKIAAWRREVTRVQLVELQEWFPHGVQALQEARVRQLVNELGLSMHEQLRQTHLAKLAPGNLRPPNPAFVGRISELSQLRTQLSGGAVGVVAAVHGIGGIGKTELAVAYAHHFAHLYQGGTWQVDADGHKDILEAISTLAWLPELGLQGTDPSDPQRLGRQVLARLQEQTREARQRDEGTGACFLLLDNVSDPALLAQSQLGLLPEQPWFHVAISTRLGLSDIGAAGSRASVAMIPVGGLGAEDAWELIREHQPARDSARLHHDFSSPEQAEAARKIVELLDGYTLAIEQTAVYLGTCEVEPSELLVRLKAQGAAVLDAVRGAADGEQAMPHKDKLAEAIIDETLAQLPERARSTLAYASLLPCDAIPCDWLEQLTERIGSQRRTGLRGLSGGDDWRATRRVLEGRRLLTYADNPRFVRLHRVLGEHFHRKLANSETEQRLDTHLLRVSRELENAAIPDAALLAVTAAALTDRLAEGRHQLATRALGLIDRVRERLGLAAASDLATTTSHTYERLAAANPANIAYQRGLAVSLCKAGESLAVRGDAQGALRAYIRCVDIFERLLAADPENPQFQRDLSLGYEALGNLRATQGNARGALDAHTRALHLREQLVAADPYNPEYQEGLAVSLDRLGDLHDERGEPRRGLEAHTQSLRIAERLAAADPDNTAHQRGLAVSFLKAGDSLARRGGDAEGALRAYIRGLDIFERLAAADPDNTEHRRDLANCLCRVGDVRAASGDVRGALHAYTRSLDISERLAAADPDNTEHQRDLASALERVADVRVASGNVQEALQVYTRSLDIAERLAAADPDNTRYQRAVAISLSKVGDLRAAACDAFGAQQTYTRSLQAVERLAAADPDNTEHQRDLSISLDRIGQVCQAQGDQRGALRVYARSLEIRERLAAADPDNIQYRRDVSVSAYKLASLLESVHDPSAADHWAKAHQILATLDAAGKLSDSDRQVLYYVTRKLDRS